jgi:hypothetical protein
MIKLRTMQSEEYYNQDVDMGKLDKCILKHAWTQYFA